MNVVRHPARRQQHAPVIPYDPADVFENLREMVRRQPRLAVLRAKNDVRADANERLRHGNPSGECECKYIDTRRSFPKVTAPSIKKCHNQRPAPKGRQTIAKGASPGSPR